MSKTVLLKEERIETALLRFPYTPLYFRHFSSEQVGCIEESYVCKRATRHSELLAVSFCRFYLPTDVEEQFSVVRHINRMAYIVNVQLLPSCRW